MTEPIEVSIDEVRDLVAERQRYDEWLDALAARRDATPAHVYERVHDDYVARRGEVLEKLHGYVDGLEGIVAELDAQLGEVDVQLRAAEDERAEAQLRHLVGEYDDASWDAVRVRVEESLALYGEERASLEARRVDVTELLEKARPLPLETADAAADATVADEASVPTPADESTAAAATEAPTDAPATSATDAGAPELAPIDVDDALAEVVAATDADEALDGAASAEAGDRPMIRGHTLDGLSVVEDELPAPPVFDLPDAASPTGATGASVDGLVTDDAPGDVFGAAVAPVSDGPATGGAEPSAPTTEAPVEGFDELAFLRSVVDPAAGSAPGGAAGGSQGEPQKTLRCTECGTMNLPTEWYCERCGGELAAF